MRITKYIFSVSILLATLFHTATLSAQERPPHRMAVFAPLYINSAFVGDSSYRYAKYVFPKFINPGLEFYEGVQLALDSLNIEKLPIEVYVYDTRSATETLEQQLLRCEADSVELILAYSSVSELRTFADAGLQRNIPVVNVNLPNDGGVTGNPFFVMINSTLRTQCEATYKFMQKNFALNEIVVFRKKSQWGDRIKNYFDDYEKSSGTASLKLKYVDLNDSFTTSSLTPHLDTVKQFLCVSGSLDENFGKRLAKQLAVLKKKYKVSVLGMPTWDNIKDFSKAEYKGIDIMYGTPFYNPKMDKVSLSIINYFNQIMYSRPSDMVFRGYEVTWKFAKLLSQYGANVSSNLSSKQNKLITEYDIQPTLNRQSMTLDYFENKKLYFLKWQNGVLKLVN